MQTQIHCTHRLYSSSTTERLVNKHVLAISRKNVKIIISRDLLARKHGSCVIERTRPHALISIQCEAVLKNAIEATRPTAVPAFARFVRR